MYIMKVLNEIIQLRQDTRGKNIIYKYYIYLFKAKPLMLKLKYTYLLEEDFLKAFRKIIIDTGIVVFYNKYKNIVNAMPVEGDEIKIDIDNKCIVLKTSPIHFYSIDCSTYDTIKISHTDLNKIVYDCLRNILKKYFLVK